MPPKTTFDAAKVKRAVTYAAFKNMGQAGAVVRMIAKRSVRKSKRPSAPGAPPHTRRGALPRAIRFAVERGADGQPVRVVIGPSADLLGPAGKPHERGGAFRGDSYPRRPFMVPALLKVRSQIPSIWRSSVREV